MQTDPAFLALHEFDEATEHLRRAQAFHELDLIRTPAAGK
jgi:hypothetical protein